MKSKQRQGLFARLSKSRKFLVDGIESVLKKGTEISDEVPAMLSDGEFVMTGQAVRGAGAFDMSQDGGIITLTPSGSESRDQGTQLMYQMMDIFSGHAEAPAETTA